MVLTLGFVPRAWQRAMTDGVIDLPANPVRAGAHAVLAVGVRPGAASDVVVKNSWGLAWGEDGYGYVTEAYLDQFGLAAHVLEAA